MKHLEKIVNIGFLAVLALFFLGGLGRTLFMPREDNEYENRQAYRLKRPTVETVLNSEFQKGVEDALSDQVLLSQTFKRMYNDGSSGYLLGLTEGFLLRHPERYIRLRDALIFGSEYLVYLPYDLEGFAEGLDANKNGLNALTARWPELDFYAYYVEKDSDVNMETGEKSGIFEYFHEGLQLPEGHFGRLEVSGFSEYKDLFYHTDHHWNYRGSYKGYTQLAEMLGVDEPLMEPEQELALPYRLSGSKAAGSGFSGVFSEDFSAYRFDFPKMDITVNDRPAGDYGRQEEFFAGSPGKVTYGAFYGGDSGEIVFDTGRRDRGNILVIGESYDNAVLKLLACHFNRTFSIDLRNYGHDLGQPFEFDRYVKEHQVDLVLFVGSGSFFAGQDFLPED